MHCFAYPPCMTLILLHGFAGFLRAAHREADVQQEIPDLLDFFASGTHAAINSAAYCAVRAACTFQSLTRADHGVAV
jgi:hypothetical protein